MKYDFSDRAHVETSGDRVSMKDRWLVAAGGGQIDTALKYCSPKELATFKSRGAVLLGSSALTSMTAATVFHISFGEGGFNILLPLAALGIGALQGLIDSHVQYRARIYAHGLAELRNAGLKLPVSESALAVSQKIGHVRVAQGITVGALGGLVFMIAANGSDIRAYMDNQFMNDNRVIEEQMAKTVDASLGRSRDALKLQTDEVNNVSRAIQSVRANDVRRAIGASRRANATSASAPNAQLAALEKRLTAEASKRDAMKSAVEAQERGRNAAIESAISDAPGHTPKRTGFSAQLQALGGLVRENPMLLFPLVGFLLISLALELGPMFCAATYMPSAYAARVALEHFLKVSRLVTDGAQSLSGARKDEQAALATLTSEDQAAAKETVSDSAPKEANDNVMPNANGAAPRRPRGRPRKNGLNSTMKEPTHE